MAESSDFCAAIVNLTGAEAEIAPLITLGRERHDLSWKERFAGAPPPLEDLTPFPSDDIASNCAVLAIAGSLLFLSCASKRRNRRSASSNRRWASASWRCYADFIYVTREWNLVTLVWNFPRMFTLRNTHERAAGLRTTRKSEYAYALIAARASKRTYIRALTRGHNRILTLRYALRWGIVTPRPATIHALDGR